MSYVLTKKGEQRIREFIKKCEEKRELILENGIDTANVEIVNEGDINIDLKREVQSFITECKTKRNEVLDNAGDTIKHTTIPTQKEILNDLNSQEDVDECWGVTDNYGMKIFLEYGIHFI